MLSMLRLHRGFGIALALALLLPALARAEGPADAVLRWNRIAVDASGLDHTPVAPGVTDHAFGEQLGPGRSSRAMAIVQIAVFEVVNAGAGTPYRSYLRLPAQTNASMEVAVATAAHDTLVAMFPSQKARLRGFLVEDLRKQPPRRALQTVRGMLLGRRAATAILSQRGADGSDFVELRMDTDFIPSHQPG